MAKVIIKSTEITHRNGEKNGKAYSMSIQERCFVELGDERFSLPITLTAGQSAYAVGEYSLDVDALLTKGKYGLEIKPFAPINLTPLSVQSVVNPRLEPVGQISKPKDEKFG
jgi:hypothetical protein